MTTKYAVVKMTGSTFEDGTPEYGTLSVHRTRAAAEKRLDDLCHVTEVWNGKRLRKQTTAIYSHCVIEVA